MRLGATGIAVDHGEADAGASNIAAFAATSAMGRSTVAVPAVKMAENGAGS
jgi:hypothetical protein